MNSSSFSWINRILALTYSRRHSEALTLYRRLLPHTTTTTTFPSTIHSHALKSGTFPNPFVLTSLISTYSLTPHHLPLAHHLLEEISPSVVLYNALISGYALHNLHHEAFYLFRLMIRLAVPFNSITLLALVPSCPPHTLPPLHACSLISGTLTNPSVANCFLTAYGRTGLIHLARKLFDEMPQRDLISWNAIISAYSQNGLAPIVLHLYGEMGRRESKVNPDAVTLVCVLSSCAHLGARAIGQEVDRYIKDQPSLSSNMFLKNALVNMHARCGDMARARKVFDEMTERSVVSWTAIIAGYGMHGQGQLAVKLFDQMTMDGIQPDGVVLVSVLSACSHSGMTDKGLEYFSCMEHVYGVAPRQEHYACMVDLLGRAGRLEEAWELMKTMPMVPDGAIWGALLGACKIHKKVELGERAFSHVVELEPANVGYYVLMSNIYSDAGMTDGVARIRAMMKQRGLKKDPGCSYSEHKGKTHLFMADDHSHPQAMSIYKIIGKLERLVKGGGEAEEMEMKEEGDEIVTGFHSEKLAIAFGLLNTEVGSEILVIKNLRVCGDCHEFTKMVSKIVDRRIVVRDASRFHHFEGGVCSCRDYW